MTFYYDKDKMALFCLNDGESTPRSVAYGVSPSDAEMIMRCMNFRSRLLETLPQAIGVLREVKAHRIAEKLNDLVGCMNLLLHKKEGE